MAFGAPTASPASSAPPSPAGGAPASPEGDKKPPFGSSPASQATPNAGADAVAVQAIGACVTMLQNVLVKVGAQSEPGQAVLKALTILTKAVPAGTVTPAVQGNVLDQARMQATQQGGQIDAIKQRAAAVGMGSGAPGGGMGAKPPMPGGMAA